MKIAILGGTGRQGSALAVRWANAGHQVFVGSRDADRAERVADELDASTARRSAVHGMGNQEAASKADVAILSVPYSSQIPVLTSVKAELGGKLLISVVAPLRPPNISLVWHPQAGSAAQEAQAILGETTGFAIAFQTISATHLRVYDHPIDSDVLICTDSTDDLSRTEQLIWDAGMRPVFAGPLANSSVIEGLTAILIGINTHYKTRGCGIRVTGLQIPEAMTGQDPRVKPVKAGP